MAYPNHIIIKKKLLKNMPYRHVHRLARVSFGESRRECRFRVFEELRIGLSARLSFSLTSSDYELCNPHDFPETGVF